MPQIPITIRQPDDHPTVNVSNITMTAPPAGSTFTYIVPIGIILNLVSMRFLFTTDATIADRFPVFSIACNNMVVFSRPQISPFSASLTATFLAAQGITAQYLTSTTLISQIPLPLNLTLQEGDEIRMTCVGIQAGDTFTEIALQALSQLRVG